MFRKLRTKRTNEEYYKSFAEHLQFEHGLNVSSIGRYVDHLKRFSVWHNENTNGKAKTWKRLTENDVRNYIIAIKPSSAYAGLIIASLGRFFCFQRDVLKERTNDPTALITRPKQVRAPPAVLEPHEIEALMKYVYKHSTETLKLRNWSLIGFLYGSGLRVTEACDLTMEQVRYQDDLPHAVNIVGKGGKGRTVVLNDTAKVALHKWFRHRPKIVLELPPDLADLYVWINPIGRFAGQPIRPPSVRKMLREMGKKALGKNVHPHMFRHSFITQAVRGGAPLHAIQAAAGHADLSTTGRYMHANEADIAGVARSVKDILRSSS